MVNRYNSKRNRRRGFELVEFYDNFAVFRSVKSGYLVSFNYFDIVSGLVDKMDGMEMDELYYEVSMKRR